MKKLLGLLCVLAVVSAYGAREWQWNANDADNRIQNAIDSISDSNDMINVSCATVGVLNVTTMSGAPTISGTVDAGAMTVNTQTVDNALIVSGSATFDGAATFTNIFVVDPGALTVTQDQILVFNRFYTRILNVDAPAITCLVGAVGASMNHGLFLLQNTGTNTIDITNKAPGYLTAGTTLGPRDGTGFHARDTNVVEQFIPLVNIP